MEVINVNAPDAGALNKTAEGFLTTARSITIDCPEMYQTAATELQQIKRKAKDLEEQRVGLVNPLNSVVKKINDLFRAPLDFLAQAESTIKRAMITFDQEQERIAAEERRKAEEAAARERARLQAEAAEREAKAKAEEDRLRKESEEAAAAGDAAKAAKLESQAEAKADAGQVRAEELRTQAAMVQAAPAQETQAKVTGIAGKSTWKGRVTNKLKLIQYVAANPQFIELVDANESAINKMAGALKKAMIVDGVEVYEERQIAARAA